jgi:hypothetical protein
MNFRLLKKATNRVKTIFHVVNSAGDICGSINVAPSEEADLLKHWQGSTVQPQASSSRDGNTNAFVAALMKNRPKFSKQAILRGCQ